MPYEQLANNASGTLIVPINSTTNLMTIDNASNFPNTGNFRIVADNEYILVTGVSANTFTIQRGIEGSTAAGHISGVLVAQILTHGGVDAYFYNRQSFDAASGYFEIKIAQASGTTPPTYNAAPLSGYLDSRITIVSGLQNNYLPLQGGTLTGALSGISISIYDPVNNNYLPTIQGGNHSINVNGISSVHISGQVYGTSFFGDGSNLTGISGAGGSFDSSPLSGYLDTKINTISGFLYGRDSTTSGYLDTKINSLSSVYSTQLSASSLSGYLYGRDSTTSGYLDAKINGLSSVYSTISNESAISGYLNGRDLSISGYLDSRITSISGLEANYLSIAGGTVTGPLNVLGTLSGVNAGFSGNITASGELVVNRLSTVGFGDPLHSVKVGGTTIYEMYWNAGFVQIYTPAGNAGIYFLNNMLVGNGIGFFNANDGGGVQLLGGGTIIRNTSNGIIADFESTKITFNQPLWTNGIDTRGNGITDSFSDFVRFDSAIDMNSFQIGDNNNGYVTYLSPIDMAANAIYDSAGTLQIGGPNQGGSVVGFYDSANDNYVMTISAYDSQMNFTTGQAIFSGSLETVSLDVTQRMRLETFSNTSPSDGDIWFDGTNFKVRLGGVTKTITVS